MKKKVHFVRVESGIHADEFIRYEVYGGTSRQAEIKAAKKFFKDYHKIDYPHSSIVNVLSNTYYEGNENPDFMDIGRERKRTGFNFPVSVKGNSYVRPVVVIK